MENVAKYRGEKMLKFPRGFGPLAEDFIKKLLNPNPTLRLGSLKVNMYTHFFFLPR
jgi:hypothetical protein